jgi:hypothetical protein
VTFGKAIEGGVILAMLRDLGAFSTDGPTLGAQPIGQEGAK